MLDGNWGNVVRKTDKFGNAMVAPDGSTRGVGRLVVLNYSQNLRYRQGTKVHYVVSNQLDHVDLAPVFGRFEGVLKDKDKGREVAFGRFCRDYFLVPIVRENMAGGVLGNASSSICMAGEFPYALRTFDVLADIADAGLAQRLGIAQSNIFEVEYWNQLRGDLTSFDCDYPFITKAIERMVGPLIRTEPVV